MSKVPKLPISKDGNRYRLDIHKSLSETGKRQRIWFRLRREAEREVARRLEVRDLYGEQGCTIPQSLAGQAAEAQNLLEPFGLSIIEAVKAHVATLVESSKSINLDQAFTRFVNTRDDLSEIYLRSIIKLAEKLPDNLMNEMLSDLTRKRVTAVLNDICSTGPQFNADRARLSAVIGEAQKDGFCSGNAAREVRKRKLTEARPHVLTVRQSMAVLKACRDFRDSSTAPYPVDCRDAIPAFALQLFAGIRPNEVARLAWKNVDFKRGHVAVPPSAAKTSDWRYIEMEPALRAWLEQWIGRADELICPSNWDRKRKQVRSASKISDHSDVLRHTFASMWLAAFGDMGGLLERMGHTTQRTTLKHYRRAVLKADALEVWKIAPKGVEIELTGVAA